ncbi:MAG: succinate--CoA ligase subunit alpha [Methanocalculaceae archaeon]|jgi:succinyl-CoA synthetase alpha subunit|nr:succinate--CoA ligase subunit alpha [Methanocalculaceae archaeon]
MIYADKDTEILVQGATGSQGAFHINLMNQYAKEVGGAGVVAGMTPGKGGQQVHGVPVYNTVWDAMDPHDIGASVIFVPAGGCGDAIMEAADARIPTAVVITEHIPVHDVMRAIAYAKTCGTKVIGPNCPGLLIPDTCKLGIIPTNLCRKGDIGVVSRSGTLTYEVISELSLAGFGQSGIIGIGGDPIIGQTFSDVMDVFVADDRTRAAVLIGEVGGNLEIRGAKRALSLGMPVVAYIAGISAPKEKRMGHAGAIVEGGESDAASKIERLRGLGIPVATRPSEIPLLVKEIL